MRFATFECPTPAKNVGDRSRGERDLLSDALRLAAALLPYMRLCREDKFIKVVHHRFFYFSQGPKGTSQGPMAPPRVPIRTMGCPQGPRECP